jgi:hypothetical protein
MTNINPPDRLWKEVRIVRNRRGEVLTLNTHVKVRLLITGW